MDPNIIHPLAAGLGSLVIGLNSRGWLVGLLVCRWGSIVGIGGYFGVKDLDGAFLCTRGFISLWKFQPQYDTNFHISAK